MTQNKIADLYRWVDSSTTDEKFPSTAFQIGTDSQGHAVYMGRAYFNNTLSPVHVVPQRKIAYLPNDGKEHTVEKFQLLCLNHFKWVPSTAGKILPGAVQGGRNPYGLPLYVAKVSYQESSIVGVIHPLAEYCSFPYQGKQVTTQNHQALVSHFYDE
ncbi:hypothetical protein Zmor_010067 [Zophobas morio]|uniref:Uncharacterized protein n=1 Tax=Zophobas morio TaxID=2755281 RepID=A0AA38IJV1_9CUCU|nr:hypothetical protein Zmor_010067 [Zophobas morio]